VDDTRAVLHRSLQAQRDHVLGILEGLDAAALSAPVLPTGWSCAGLVRHLALDVERFWFRDVVAGDATAAVAADAPSAWELDPSTAPESVLALYRREAALADTVITSTALDAAPAAWPDELFGEFRLADLQAVLLHVLTETACHAGHLDAARELLDGRTWLVL